MEKLNSFSCLVGNSLAGYIRDISRRSYILNVYAPYKEQEGFWETMEATGILHSPSLVWAGDLNCTLGIKELWGQSRAVGRMAQKLRDIILTHNLIDVCPPKNSPTLDNGRSGTNI